MLFSDSIRKFELVDKVTITNTGNYYLTIIPNSKRRSNVELVMLKDELIALKRKIEYALKLHECPVINRQTNMITLITGKRASGTTEKAKEITNGKSAVWLNEASLKHPFWASRITDNTEVIIIDEVKNKDIIEPYLGSGKLKIEKQGQKPEVIDMPNIILISQTLNKNDFPNPNMNVIECKICYKTNEPCKYNCNGLCKESY